ncbi:hypothetical protein J6590_067368 [Homalodisca vitripennis]|nr:hypothetical protein J6590_067368 [Homalodisca vitripennis]
MTETPNTRDAVFVDSRGGWEEYRVERKHLEEEEEEKHIDLRTQYSDILRGFHKGKDKKQEPDLEGQVVWCWPRSPTQLHKNCVDYMRDTSKGKFYRSLCNVRENSDYVRPPRDARSIGKQTNSIKLRQYRESSQYNKRSRRINEVLLVHADEEEKMNIYAGQSVWVGRQVFSGFVTPPLYNQQTPNHIPPASDEPLNHSHLLLSHTTLCLAGCAVWVGRQVFWVCHPSPSTTNRPPDHILTASDEPLNHPHLLLSHTILCLAGCGNYTCSAVWVGRQVFWVCHPPPPQPTDP